jgi:hypothetical protein
MNKKRDDRENPMPHTAGSELKARLGLEPVLIDQIWYVRLDDLKKAFGHVDLMDVKRAVRGMDADEGMNQLGAK